MDPLKAPIKMHSNSRTWCARFLLIGALALFSPFTSPMAHAGPEVEAETNAPASDIDLVMQVHRPTVQQIQAWVAGGMRMSIDGLGLSAEQKIWVDLIVRQAPKMIASFEQAVPGATWAFVGRDTALLADVFEMFYLSIGQTGRVARIGVSSRTFDSATPDQLIALLRQNGLSIDSPSPFILVDTISRGGGRQLRQLLTTIYDWAKKSSLRPDEIAHRFNLIGLRISTTSSNYDDISNIEDVFTRTAALLSSGSNIVSPAQIPLFTDARPTGTNLGINESGYEHWLDAWHGPYQGITINSQTGDVTAAPSLGNLDVLERRRILLVQALLWKKLREPTFRRQVGEEALKLGYAFPLKRPLFSIDPLAKLRSDLDAARDAHALISAIRLFAAANLKPNRVPPAVDAIVNTMIKALHVRPEPSPNGKLEVKRFVDQLSLEDKLEIKRLVSQMPANSETMTHLMGVLNANARSSAEFVAVWAPLQKEDSQNVVKAHIVNVPSYYFALAIERLPSMNPTAAEINQFLQFFDKKDLADAQVRLVRHMRSTEQLKGVDLPYWLFQSKELRAAMKDLKTRSGKTCSAALTPK